MLTIREVFEKLQCCYFELVYQDSVKKRNLITDTDLQCKIEKAYSLIQIYSYLEESEYKEYTKNVNEVCSSFFNCNCCTDEEFDWVGIDSYCEDNGVSTTDTTSSTSTTTDLTTSTSSSTSTTTQVVLPTSTTSTTDTSTTSTSTTSTSSTTSSTTTTTSVAFDFSFLFDGVGDMDDTSELLLGFAPAGFTSTTTTSSTSTTTLTPSYTCPAGPIVIDVQSISYTQITLTLSQTGVTGIFWRIKRASDYIVVRNGEVNPMPNLPFVFINYASLPAGNYIVEVEGSTCSSATSTRAFVIPNLCSPNPVIQSISSSSTISLTFITNADTVGKGINWQIKRASDFVVIRNGNIDPVTVTTIILNYVAIPSGSYYVEIEGSTCVSPLSGAPFTV